ncbi:MAG: response regulator [Acidobacteria bacterium]|nr:response regulator [Acidobacteriota bacterium]MCA1612045.1 response regulator [Acidobacteriota bacterium]
MSGEPRILVVDDDASVREALRDLLSGEGYAVVTADDGQDALDRLGSMDPPCLILLDLRMPRIDGWEFLARRDGPGKKTPVVLLSGMAFIRDAPGVADFLAKPIRPDKLLDCVRRFCKR